MSVLRERGLWSLVVACAFACACGEAWPFVAQPCVPSTLQPPAAEPDVGLAAGAGHLRQLGHVLPVAESPPADSDGWEPAALTGSVVVRQSLGSGRPGYVWGVKVETPDGAPVLLQPLPMRTRAVGLRLAAGDYSISTYRHACVDGCARVAAPVRHCRAEVHVEAGNVVDLGESSPDRSCRLLHRPPAPAPKLASVGVRHMTSDGAAQGWYLRWVESDDAHSAGMGVALAPFVDALTLWVEAGSFALETHAPGHPARPGCRSDVEAAVGDAIEVVHTHGPAGCRPYRAQAPVLSLERGGAVTAGDR